PRWRDARPHPPRAAPRLPSHEWRIPVAALLTGRCGLLGTIWANLTVDEVPEAVASREPAGSPQMAFQAHPGPLGLLARIHAQKLLADLCRWHLGRLGVQEVHVEPEMRFVIRRQGVFRRRLVGQFDRCVPHPPPPKILWGRSFRPIPNYIC